MRRANGHMPMSTASLNCRCRRTHAVLKSNVVTVNSMARLRMASRCRHAVGDGWVFFSASIFSTSASWISRRQ
jgi:hypothetical protein